MGRRILEMSDGFLPMLLDQWPKHYRVTKDAIPADTRVLSVQVRFIGQDHQNVLFLMESSEWEPVEEGMPYPEFSPTITTIEVK